MKNQRGVVYLEMLIGFLPVFMFFLGTLQVADLSVAHLVVEHAATTAARAAVVVLPDDGAYYEDADNAAVNEFRDYRQSDVERAADTILAANPRLDSSSANVALDKPKYEEREIVTTQVTAPYRCLVPIFCAGGVTISSQAKLVYQGAHYVYEPSTGWASSAANRGLENIKNKVSDYRDEKNQEGDPDQPDVDDDPTNDAANQKKVDDLEQALPPKLRNVPIQVDPSLEGSTVRVHYTHDDKGRITGIEVRVGPDAQARHIQDHVATIKAMQRYQGVAGKARALAQRFKNWLTGNPNAGPGTLAWETHREVEKLTGIIENRAKQLEAPNLTDAQRKELERELESYEKQLAHHEKVLEDVTNEPGRGYVAANAQGRTGREQAEHDYGPDVPNPPDGYHWSLAPDGSAIVVRDRTEDADGQPRPPRKYDPTIEAKADDPLAQWPERDGNVIPARYRTDDEAISGEQPVTAPVRERATERRTVAKAKATAKRNMDALAKKAKIDADLTKADGAGIIAKEREKAEAEGDTARVALLDKLAKEQAKYKANELELQRQSEQLGNAMTEEYMAANHKEYTQTYPPPGTPYTPGKSGEFDYVYTKGDPPTSVIIVEAKGAGADLGTGANGTASQGSPQYMRHVAEQMYEKQADKSSPAAKMWKAIAEGDTDAPEVRYIKVQAPVTKNGDPRPGRISEFDLSQPPPEQSTNP